MGNERTYTQYISKDIYRNVYQGGGIKTPIRKLVFELMLFD